MRTYTKGWLYFYYWDIIQHKKQRLNKPPLNEDGQTSVGRFHLSIISCHETRWTELASNDLIIS
jgi:hypothetical protein